MTGPVTAMLPVMLEPYPDGTGADIALFLVTGMRIKALFWQWQPQSSDIVFIRIAIFSNNRSRVEFQSVNMSPK